MKPDNLPETRAPNVVLIEDDQALRFMLCQTLKRYGFATADFSNPEEFFVWLKANPAPKACLLLDMRLPAMNGLEVQTKLDSLGAQLPIVFMSGNSHISEAIAGMKHGAIDFLLKPFDETSLVRAVERSLGRFNPQAPANPYRLTPRERLVLAYIAQGMRSEQIADTLGLSVRTIKMHRSNILHKTGANTMTEAVLMVKKPSTATL
ncbi:MAG: response regulator [Burkholderiaceae bacterium]|nr:response regulator [Burkholderiaceae bacterium]MCD8516675.1 response regulator [Burkholderiaceae bacterium]MCD8536276.1 response regulator [Burkholderiaceae bacterium]MCD8564749.1 response regulator [Burkholderiaceae bacterium]